MWSQESVSARLPELAQILDVRERQNGIYPKNSVWIPFSDLKNRLSELPAPDRPIEIAQGGPESEMAVTFLEFNQRKALLSPSLEWTDQPQNFRLWEPNPFLKDWCEGKSPAKALDLGCGAGRDATFLSGLGWCVEAVDHLPDAIERAKKLADRYLPSHQIQWRLASATDLKQNGAELVCLFFCFHPTILQSIGEKLNGNFTVLIESFSATHFKRFGKPGPDRIVSQPLLESGLPHFKIELYEEDWRASGKHTARAVLTLKA